MASDNFRQKHPKYVNTGKAFLMVFSPSVVIDIFQKKVRKSAMLKKQPTLNLHITDKNPSQNNQLPLR